MPFRKNYRPGSTIVKPAEVASKVLALVLSRRALIALDMNWLSAVKTTSNALKGGDPF
jgi:hypothetical protein